MDPDLSPILHALLENQGLQKISDDDERLSNGKEV